jgi:hypothetical protein
VTGVSLNEDVNEVTEHLLIGAAIQDDKPPRLQWLRVG